MQITVDLLILSGVSSKSLSINSAFSCWFVDFVNDSLCQTQKFRGTGCISLLICWFYIVFLSVWVLIVRFAVDLLIFNFELLIDQKIQSNRLQITVDLLILSGVSSKSLSINSAFSCWFVDFVNDSLCQTQKIRGTGCRSLLICWFYFGFLLGVWVLIARFAVDLLIFQFLTFNRPKNSE